MTVRAKVFYVVLFWLILFDSFLLSKPNLLGKIGLLVYKYYYLRTFPRTLLTVTAVVSIALVIGWVVQYLVARVKLSKAKGILILGIGISGALLLLVKTIVDFSSWSYSHTGWRFKYGAYFLSVIVMIVFGYFIIEIMLIKRQVEQQVKEYRT